MKSKFAWIWFVVSVALGVLLIIQVREGNRRKVLLEQTQLQVENKQSTSENRVRELEQERQKLRGDLNVAEYQLNSMRLAYSGLAGATNAPAANPTSGAQASASTATSSPMAGMQNMFAQMMKDPEMRKVMEQQQRVAMETMYASLFKKLQLAPDKEQKLKDILVDQQMSSISQAGSVLDQNATNRTEMIQKLSEDHQKREQQIKETIGEDKFAQYQDYTQTIGERVMFDQYGKQLELTPEQTDQLLNIMREEKKNAQINTGAAPYDATKDWQKVLQENGMAEQLMAQQEQANQRVLDRAGQVLTAEQLQKLGPVLQNQLTMQKAGLKMARQMFGGSQSPAPGSSPAPAP